MTGRSERKEPTSFQSLGSAVSPIMLRLAAARRAQRLAANSNSPDVLRGAVRCDEPKDQRAR